MTAQELVKLSSQKVRRDSDLMAFYIKSFKAQFGKSPNCAGCTFSTDFIKLKKALEQGMEPQKTMAMNIQGTTFKLAKRQGKIVSFKKGGRTIRQYDNKMTEEFAVGYLTNGTKEELLERKKLFKVLPAEILAKEEKKKPKQKQPEVKEIIEEKIEEIIEVVEKKEEPKTKKKTVKKSPKKATSKKK